MNLKDETLVNAFEALAKTKDIATQRPANLLGLMELATRINKLSHRDWNSLSLPLSLYVTAGQ